LIVSDECCYHADGYHNCKFILENGEIVAAIGPGDERFDKVPSREKAQAYPNYRMEEAQAYPIEAQAYPGHRAEEYHQKHRAGESKVQGIRGGDGSSEKRVMGQRGGGASEKRGLTCCVS
jgi:hypothetical protein